MPEYIDRKLLLEKAWDADTRAGYVQVVDVGDVLAVPAADVAPVVHGKWINPQWKRDMFCYNCSNCRGEAMHREYRWSDKKTYPICPNCGARMYGER